MNSQDPLSNSTISQLRGPLPDREPRPGFETRLMENIRRAPGPASPPRARNWLLAAAGTTALAALLAMVLLRPADRVAGTTVPQPRPVLEVRHLPNPLEEELAAVSDSATRAGRFLISHLPSLPMPEKAL